MDVTSAASRRFRDGLSHLLLLSFCHWHTRDLAGNAHARYSNERSMTCRRAERTLNSVHAIYLDEPLVLQTNGFDVSNGVKTSVEG
jgi:hypothetical protein